MLVFRSEDGKRYSVRLESEQEAKEVCEMLKELLHVRRMGHCPMFSGGTLKPSFQELLTPTQEPQSDNSKKSD